MEDISQSISGKVIILLKHENQDIALNALNQIREKIKENRLPIIEQSYESMAEDYTTLFKSLYPYRAGLLSENDRKGLLEGQSKEIVEQAMLEAINSFSTLGPVNLHQDPFYLFPGYVTSFQKDQSIEIDENGNLVVRHKDELWTIFQGNLTNSAFSFKTQDAISANLMPLLAKFQHQGIHVSTIGAVFHALKGSEQAKNEVSHIGVLSMLCIIGLLLLVFKSLALFRIVAAIIISAVVVGIACCLLIFQQIHILSLVFGCSLVGVCVDYAIHYYCKIYGVRNLDDRFDILRKLTPALPLAFLSSCVGYLLLVFVPFPGVQQMAILTSTGLLGAFVSVYLWGPYLVRMNNQKLPIVGEKINSLLHHMINFGLKVKLNSLLTITMMIVFSIGMAKIHFEDRLQYFQPLNDRLKNDEELFKSMVSYDHSFQYIKVQDASLESVLQRIESLMPDLERLKLQNTISGYRSIASLIPSERRQQENRILVKTLYQENLQSLLDKLNINEISNASSFDLNGPLLATLPDLPEGWRDLIQVKENLIIAKIVLMNVQDPLVMVDFIKKHPNIQYVDPVNEYAELFSFYRHIITAAIILVLGIMAVLVSFYKNVKMMIEIISPIILSMMFTIGLLSCFGFPLTLFHILGLMLVQTLGIDYALFLYWKEKGSNLLANALTAITTILSFGFLTFSSSPAIHDFGLSVFIGILTCFFITTFFIGKPMQTGGLK